MSARLGRDLLQHVQAERRDRAHARQRVEQAAQPDRLQQVVDRVQFERLQRIGVVGGGEDHRRRVGELLQVLRGFDAIHLRHADVEQHHIGRRVPQQLEQRAPVRRFAHHLERETAAQSSSRSRMRLRAGASSSTIDDAQGLATLVHAHRSRLRSSRLLAVGNHDVHLVGVVA